jgi:hypothetical protein
MFVIMAFEECKDLICSQTESTSPNNEETSQDLSQSETPSNVSDINHVYNVIYPGFYYNGACQPQGERIELYQSVLTWCT